LGETAGYHGLRRRRVSCLAKPNNGSGDQKKEKVGGEAAHECRRAPADDANRDDGLAAEAIGKESKRQARDGEDNEEQRVKGPKLSIGSVEMIAQERNEGNNRLPCREVDKID